MESIKERARSYALKKTGYSPFYKEHEAAYIEIATEQKAIDIEKAKEAFNKTCGWLAVYPWYNGVFEEFVKAMEE